MSNISEFYKTPDPDYVGFFDEITSSVDVTESYKKVNHLRKQLEEAQAEYTARINCDLKSTVTPLRENVVLEYSGRNMTLYFDALTGTAITEDGFDLVNDILITLDGRTGDFNMPIGYCYKLGALVTRKFNYTIPSNNSKANLRFKCEYLIPLINNKNNVIYSQNSVGIKEKLSMSQYYFADYIPNKLKCTQFVEEMFGIPNTNEKFNKYQLNTFYTWTINNKSYQTILSIDDPIALGALMAINFKEVAPPHKLLEITKETLDKLCAENRLNTYITIYRMFNEESGDDKRRLNEAFSKTFEEWADFAIKSKQWEETLQFYNIRCSDGNAALDLIRAYARIGWTYRGRVKFHEYYKFGKFCKYVIEETVEQGFSKIESFIITLSDYIEVCNKYSTVPTLYSRELQKVHDVVVRNHSITFSADQIASFNDKYVGYKEPVIDNYQIIYPKSPNDMVKEGDSLNHCCAFYVKKVLDNECKVLFLRLKDKIEESLITFEIKGTSITQAEGFLHRDPNETEMKILEKYAKDNALTMAL